MDSLRILGDLIQIQSKHRVNILSEIISKGRYYAVQKYKDDKYDTAKSLDELATIAKECRMIGLDVMENIKDSVREHGYHSGSWDVDAYSITITFPISPAYQVLYAKK